MTRDEIFLLLEKNQISMRPDDGAAIDAIEKYINGIDTRKKEDWTDLKKK